MSSITVRNLPEKKHRALRVRASMVGRITKAEVRVILENATCPDSCVNLGSLLAEIGREAGGFERPAESAVRNTEPVSFE